MTRLVPALALALLLIGCSSGPPADLAGTWVGYMEPAASNKTGLQLDLRQDKNKLTGTYKLHSATSMGDIDANGTLEGTVSGNSTTLKMSQPSGGGMFSVDPEIDLELSEDKQDGRVLAGVVVPKSGMGTKYRVHQPVKK